MSKSIHLLKADLHTMFLHMCLELRPDVSVFPAWKYFLTHTRCQALPPDGHHHAVASTPARQFTSMALSYSGHNSMHLIWSSTVCRGSLSHRPHFQIGTGLEHRQPTFSLRLAVLPCSLGLRSSGSICSTYNSVRHR